MKILTAEATLSTTIQSIIKNMPATIREQAAHAFEAEINGDTKKVQEITTRLLDTPEGEHEVELYMLLGRSYFMTGNIIQARMVFQDAMKLAPDEVLPKLYHAMTLHGMGDYASAVKEFDSIYPLDFYHPFFYTSYGDSLEKIGQNERSREIFAEEIKYFKSTGAIASPEMLDGAFQHLLYLDITLANGHYDSDLNTYYQFLDKIEFTDNMQQHVASTIIYLCSLNTRKWYWNKFTELVDHIREKGYITKKECQDTLDSSYASLETFQYTADENVSELYRSFLNSCYEKHYMKLDEDILPKEEKDNILATYWSFVWYMAEYIRNNQPELSYISEHYPLVYKISEPTLSQIRSNPDDMQENAVMRLISYTTAGTSAEKIRKDLQDKYAEITDSDAGKIVSNGSTYERDQIKIGRNDPCPCGSGKKYKQCCGR